MLREFVEYLVSLAQPPTVEVDGRTYMTEDYNAVEEPAPNPLGLATLTGLVTYLTQPGEPDQGQRFSLGDLDVMGTGHALVRRLAVHVAAPDDVQVVAPCSGRFNRRLVLARAVSPNRCQFRFNTYVPQEDFILGLLAGFVLNPDAQTVLAVAGNLTAESTVTLADDGVSQSASLREGVVRQTAAMVPSPVMLRPYRTFPEIPQPESPFVFRVSKGPENAPRCGLFPVLTEAWRLEAVDSIVAWLRGRLPAGVDVIG